MFPKDSLILPSPPKFYPSHSLVCCKSSKVAWVKFRESVQGVLASERFSGSPHRSDSREGPTYWDHLAVCKQQWTPALAHLYYLLALTW